MNYTSSLGVRTTARIQSFLGLRLATGRCKTPRGEYKGTKEFDIEEQGEHRLTGISRTVVVHTLVRIVVQWRCVEFSNCSGL